MDSLARSLQGLRPGSRTIALLVAALLSLLLLIPPRAHADSPSTRGKTPTAGVGGTESGEDTGEPLTHPTTIPQGMVEAPGTPWQGVQPLPPPGAPRMPQSPQDLAQPQNIQVPILSDAWDWATENLNPGKWVLNAGLGIVSGFIKGVTGLLEGIASSLIQSAAPSTGMAAQDMRATGGICQDAVAIVLFCTPTNMTSANQGVHRLWSALRPIALCIVAILFVLSLGRLMMKGQQTLMTEGKSLLLHFVAAVAFAALSPNIIAWMIDLANGLNSLVLSAGPYDGGIIFPGNGEFSLGILLLNLVFWFVFIIAIFKSFWLTAQIMVLISISPVAGALLLDRSTAGRFNTWLTKLIDALLQKTAWAILFLLSSSIFSNFQSTAAERGLAVAYSIMILLMILFGQNVLGIFSSSSSSMGFFGAYLSVRGLTRMAGAARRVGGGWFGRSGDKGGGGSTPAPDPTPDSPTGPGGGDGGPRTTGDPAQSHYMQRHAFGGPRSIPRAPTLQTSRAASTRGTPAVERGGSGTRGQAPRPNPLRAATWRRTPRGLQPATFEGNLELRSRASAIRDRFDEQVQRERASAAELRRRGLDEAAQEREQRIAGLERKRDLHAQIARTGMVPERRPPTPLEERERRQAIWRQAQLETQGEIQAEQETLRGRANTLEAERQRLTGLSAKVQSRALQQATRQREAGNGSMATELLQGGQQRIDRIDSARQAVQEELSAVRARQAALIPTLSDDPASRTKTTSLAARQRIAQKGRAREATQRPQRPATPFTERFGSSQTEAAPAGQPASGGLPRTSTEAREQARRFADRRRTAGTRRDGARVARPGHPGRQRLGLRQPDSRLMNAAQERPGDDELILDPQGTE